MGVSGVVVGGLVSGGLGYLGSQSAAGAENQASNNSLALQQSEFNTEEANAAPYLQSGTNALNTLNSDMPSLEAPFTMQDFQESPGYQFQLNQGLQAMQRSAASKGLLNSVGTQQNLNTYAQGSANTDYQQALTNYMNQNQQKYSMLSGVANMGLNATGLANSAASNYANSASNTMMGAANATAAGTIGATNAATGAISSTTNGLMNYNLMSNLFQNQNPSGLTMPQLGSSAGYGSNGVGGYNFQGGDGALPTSYNSPTLGSILPTD